MNLEEAYRIENRLFNDVSKMGKDFIILTHTFKDSQLRRPDNSPERMRAVGHNIRQACQSKDFRIRLNDLAFLIKDEVQHSTGHCHTPIWLEPLRRKKININYFLNVLHGYWSAPFESYRNSSWRELENSITEPKHGWLKSEFPKEGTELHSLRYQTKFVKNDIVVGANYHASRSLVKKLNSMNEELYILERN